MRSALIVGLTGETLTAPERALLRDARPAGVILFARNCRDHDQIRALTAACREAVGSDELLVLIDQEGGRVQRLRPPLGRALPPAESYANIYATDPARAARWAFLAARLVAADLHQLGINTNCTPVLDVPVPGAHDVIGDRAFGTTPEQIAVLGRAVAEGFLAGGVLPVIKHIPGHGRATADSHFDLPVVATPRAELSATDFAPFKALADMPIAMTAHVLYSAIDAERPVSTSAAVIRDVVRGEIGFDNLLLSDDLSMKALGGPMRARAEAVIAADCDLALHCNGDFAEMEAAAAGVPPIAGTAAARLGRAWALLPREESFDVAEAESALASVLGPRRTESV